MITLRDITLQCPICGTWFASKAAAGTGDAAGTRTDFHRRANGPEPLAHQVHMCSGCGFAGVEDDFASDAESGASAAARGVDRTAGPAGNGVAGSEKYEAAAGIAERRGEGPRTVADLLIKAAWCCIDEGDVEGERFFRRKAAQALESALARYDDVKREERAVTTYLVGELWRRVGDRTLAREWFDRVDDEVTDAAAQRWIVVLAAQQRDRPREWLG